MNNIAKFLEWEKKVEAYNMAMRIIGVDSIAVPPSQGQTYRSEHTAILAGELFKLKNDPEMFEVMEPLLGDDGLLERELTEEGIIGDDALLERELTEAGIAGKEGMLEREVAAGDKIEGTPEQDKEKLGDIRRRVELYYQSALKQKSLPVEKYVEFQKVLDKSKVMWLKAKAENDWKGYAPVLKDVFDRYAELISYRDSNLSIYDRMLDDNESGMTTKEYDIFFNQMKERLIPIIKRNNEETVLIKNNNKETVLIKNNNEATHLIRENNNEATNLIKQNNNEATNPIKENNNETTPLWSKEYDIDKQRIFMNEVLEFIGFTKEWGRMTESEHPLTSGISSGDIRFTTHYRINNPVQSTLSTIHESGHAWYTHNVDSKYDGTIISSSINAAMHESQSRFCENHLGRSKAFWEVHYPRLQELFSDQFKGVSLEEFYQTLNESKPSFIRTQADELTYPVHILIRYEIEKEVFAGKLNPMDLMEVWNAKYKEYLGLEVKDASTGILQDMHWPYAYFGYFPTYALGSAYAAQFDYYMRKEIDPDKLIRENRYTDIMMWLKNNVQKYGNRYKPGEVIKMATGECFNPKYYFDYLEKKYSK